MQEYTLPDGDREVVFIGELLGEATSHQTGKPRWFEVRIFRTEGGSYIVAGAGKTVYEDETDRCWVKVSMTAAGAVESLHQVDDDNVRYLTRVSQQALDRACVLDGELCQEYKLQRIR